MVTRAQEDGVTGTPGWRGFQLIDYPGIRKVQVAQNALFLLAPSISVSWIVLKSMVMPKVFVADQLIQFQPSMTEDGELIVKHVVDMLIKIPWPY